MKKTMLLISVFVIQASVAISQIPSWGLLMNYSFEGHTVDNSGNGRNAQTTHTWYETGANGVAGHAIAVDGDSSSTIYYDYTNEWTNFNFQSFTVSTWARFDDLQTSYSNIFEMGFGQIFLRLMNAGGGGRPQFGIFTTGGTWAGSNTNAPFHQLDYWQEWHHFTLTSELSGSGVDREFKLYIDGELYHTENIVGNMTTDAMINHNAVGNGPTSIFIGYRQGNGTLATDGNFQDFTLYARSLTESEVGQLYDNLCLPTYYVMNVSTCDQYELNNQTYYQSGTYTQVLPNTGGCDSTITLNLSIYETPYAEIIQNGWQLEATYLADSYEWINCSDSSIIPFSNSQQFTPDVPGQYAVILFNGNTLCSATSDCFDFTLGIDDASNALFQIYPNPASDLIQIDGLTSEAIILVSDQLGRIVLETSVSSTQNTVSTEELAGGSYAMLIAVNGKIYHKKIQVNR